MTNTAATIAAVAAVRPVRPSVSSVVKSNGFGVVRQYLLPFKVAAVPLRFLHLRRKWVRGERVELSDLLQTKQVSYRCYTPDESPNVDTPTSEPTRPHLSQDPNPPQTRTTRPMRSGPPTATPMPSNPLDQVQRPKCDHSRRDQAPDPHERDRHYFHSRRRRLRSRKYTNRTIPNTATIAQKMVGNSSITFDTPPLPR